MIELNREACALPTPWGVFRLTAVRDAGSPVEHAILSMGDLTQSEPLLLRIHSECLTGDAFGSTRCDCGAQLKATEARIAQEGRGAILYLRQEGRGIGLFNKVQAYCLQDRGADTVDANRLLGLPDDARDYAICAAILDMLGVRRVRLMTNNPAKVEALQALGIEVCEIVPMRVGVLPSNRFYLETKQDRMRHQLGLACRPSASCH